MYDSSVLLSASLSCSRGHLPFISSISVSTWAKLATFQVCCSSHFCRNNTFNNDSSLRTILSLVSRPFYCARYCWTLLGVPWRQSGPQLELDFFVRKKSKPGYWRSRNCHRSCSGSHCRSLSLWRHGLDHCRHGFEWLHYDWRICLST